MRNRWRLSAILTLTLVAAASGAAADPSTDSPQTTERDPEASHVKPIAVARKVMTEAVFATFVTLDESGAPQGRIMDPLPPTDELVVWMATNPMSRKVSQIQADPRVALTYFETSGPSYVTLHGQARLVDDAAEKAARWKKEWEPHYPDRDESLLLIEVRPTRIELISVPHGLTGDPETWTPDQVELPATGGPPETSAAGTAHSPYKELGSREIKALAPERIAGLEAGHGLGYALPAELNRYPGPKHALELAETLDLSPSQVEAVKLVYDKMHHEAVRSGRELIEAERRLDRLFADSTADPESLEEATRAAAAAEGRVRLAHLRAHLETAELLDRHQTHLYYSARGYGSTGDHGHAHHPGH